MLHMHKQPMTVPSLSSESLNDASLWRFPESTTPETFLALDPAGFLTHNISGVNKRSCVFRVGRTPSTTAAMRCWTKVEPALEPCTDEIPWTDLVFWLGNASTGEMVCSCAQCGRWAMQSCNGNFWQQHRYSSYHHQQQRVSSRVLVINLPLIEGVD